MQRTWLRQGSKRREKLNLDGVKATFGAEMPSPLNKSLGVQIAISTATGYKTMTLLGILENLISDVLFLILAIIIGWALYKLSHRAKLLKFFGIEKSRRIILYASNLRVKTGGAIGISGQQLSYQGSTAAFGEIVEANRFRGLFNFLLPSLSEAPGLLSKLLVSDVQVQILLSPLDNSQIESSTSFVTLGSPAYNIASGFAEKELHSKAKFGLVPHETQSPSPTIPSSEAIYTGATGSITAVLDLPVIDTAGTATPFVQPSGIAPFHFQSAEQVSAILIDGVPPMTDVTYGFVERFVNQTNKRSIFYAAGISELATAGAAYYLISEWENLERKFDAEFLVVLKFDPMNYRRWSIVFEK